MSPQLSSASEGFNKRMEILEKRVDTLEAWRHESTQWANDQHALLLAEIVKLEKNIMDKLDAKEAEQESLDIAEKTTKNNQKFFAILAAPAWLISIVALLWQIWQATHH